MSTLFFYIYCLISMAFAEECDTVSGNNIDVGSLRTPRIAVIGGGIAGSSFSHYIDELFHGNVRTHIFEARHRLCGRVEYFNVTDEMDGSSRTIEMGGSVWVKENKNIEEFVAQHAGELTKREKKENGADSLMGIWDHHQLKFVFEESSSPFLTLWRALWRYGRAPLRVNAITRETVDKFVRLYDDERPFESVRELMERVDLLHATSVSLHKFLLDQGVDERYISEVAAVATRVNYGQSMEMSAFAGLITLVAMQSTLYQLEQGNARLCDLMVRHDSVHVQLDSYVTRIERLKGPSDERATFLVSTEDGDTQTFDLVVMATPHIRGVELEFVNVDDADRMLVDNLHITWAFFVVGQLRASFFDVADPLPFEHVLTMESAHVPFTSVSLLHRFANGTGLYKVFARAPVSDAVFQRLFGAAYELIDTRKWRAYPKLPPSDASKWPPILVADGDICHINALEQVVSTIETETVAARNCARLLLRRWIEINR